MLTNRITKQELKEDIIRQIDHLHKNELIELRRYLAKLIAQRLIGIAACKAEDGLFTGEAIQEAVLQHRQQHPYR